MPKEFTGLLPQHKREEQAVGGKYLPEPEAAAALTGQKIIFFISLLEIDEPAAMDKVSGAGVVFFVLYLFSA